MKIIGTIRPKTIYHVEFSAKGIIQKKCTSTNTYINDAEKFAKKYKVVEVTMRILCELGTEYQDK